LLDPHRHDGRAYRPTGPKLLTGAEIADAMGEALGRRVRHIDIPPRMFMKALRANEKRLGFDEYTQSGLRHYLPETALGTWEVGGPTTHVRDVAGVEPEDFLTIARRYVNGLDTRRTAGNFMGEVRNFILVGLTPAHRLDKFDRLQQHPQPAHTRHSGESVVWQNEHTASAGAKPNRLGVFEIHSASVSQGRTRSRQSSS
ncbi:MAG: hypothetical protein WBV80_23935, partial [Mycobacterium sp.]